MNKRNLVLQTAVAGIFASGSAFAAVTISATPVVPAPFAQEIIATTAAPVTLINAANVLDITTAVGYSLSDGEVRYVRMELTNGAKFITAAVTSSVPASCTVGAVNGVGTSAIYFSLTAVGAGCTSTTTLSVDGNRSVTSNSDVNASYALYDLPSQSQAGGTTGRIVNVENKAYIDFTNSYVVDVTTGSAVADVSASGGAYRAFTGPSATKPISTINYKLATAVPSKINGTAITLADLMATGTTGTKLTITGDFSTARNSDGTYTLAALNRVFLSASATCASPDLYASTVSATGATFNVGATATTAYQTLCYTANGTDQIAASTYTGVLNAVSVAPTVYAVTNIDKGTVGTITRNGTELQTPWFSTFGTTGYQNRFVIMNTGTTDVTYTTTVRAETGNTVTNGSAATGTIAAGKQVVINASDIASFSGNTRASISFTINSAPGNIKAAFQQVNAASGNVTNVPLERVYSGSQF